MPCLIACHANVVSNNMLLYTQYYQYCTQLEALSQDPEVAQIAKKYGKTVAQTLLRWGLQHGTSVIPKSSKAEHSRVC